MPYNKQISIGLDIGGSHVTSAAFDLNEKEIIASSVATKQVDGHDTSDAIIQNWADVIAESKEKAGDSELAGIGFAMPGPFDYENGIGRFELVDKFENLNGVDVFHELKNKLGLSDKLPIRFINDATAFALGEALIGKGKRYRNVMVITLGTGFGSAFIKAGVPVVNGSDVPKQGCLWHVNYKESIADDYFSTRWFLNEYKKLTHNSATGVKQIAEEAKVNFTIACLFEYFGHNLAEFLSPHIQTFETQAIILGGNISKAYPLFKESFENKLQNKQKNIDIHVSVLKEDAAIYGASLLTDNELYERIKPTLKFM